MLPMYFKKADVDKRKHQINTLKIFNEYVREITEDSEYEVPFRSGDNDLTLRVSLGSDFPNEKPVLAISPPVLHPWLNESGTVTSAPGLLNFTVLSDLGRVVQAIIRELQRNPPPLVSKNNVISQNIPVINGENRTTSNFSSNFSFSPPSHPNLSHRKSTTIHPFCSAFPELKNLTLEELNFLNENEDRQAEFLDELPVIKEQNKTFDDVIQQIEDLAEDNLKKGQQIEELQQAVDSRIEEVTKLSFDNERLYTVYQDLSEKYSPRNIQEELGKGAKSAEEESEKIAESFLQGDLDVDKFLNIFIKSKALCQLRKTKEEKLCHQLDRLEKAGF